MSSKSEFAALDVMHRLGKAGEKVCLTKKDWADLAQDAAALQSLAAWRRGRAKIEMLPVIVDCSTPLPKIGDLTPLPDSEQIASRFTGKLTLTPEAASLFLVPGQRGNGSVVGNVLRSQLGCQPVFTAHVLEAYLKNPELIPEMFNGNFVFFWGTVYHDSKGSLCVRYLCRIEGVWRCDDHWLEFSVNSAYPAAILASHPTEFRRAG